MTPRELTFANHFIVNSNGAKSAKLAKYSDSGAKVQAHRLLRKPTIVRYIERKQRELSQKTSIDQETIIRDLQNLYLKSLEARQFSIAIKAIQEQSKILGFYKQ